MSFKTNITFTEQNDVDFFVAKRPIFARTAYYRHLSARASNNHTIHVIQDGDRLTGYLFTNENAEFISATCCYMWLQRVVFEFELSDVISNIEYGN